jgi:DNA-binding transcriptional ArsR family regulator
MNDEMIMNNEILAVAPVQSLDALRALADGQRHRMVTLLMDEALTAKELAERLGIGRTRLYYHLAMLDGHGLIRTVDTRMVSGIVERKYRAVARTFRVDRALLASQASEAEVSEAQASILDAVANDLRALGLPGTQPPDPDLLVSRTFLRLSDARRLELRMRLCALVEEYRDADEGGREVEMALALFASTGNAQ